MIYKNTVVGANVSINKFQSGRLWLAEVSAIVCRKPGINTVGCTHSVRTYPKSRFDYCDRVLLNHPVKRIIVFQGSIFHPIFAPGSAEVCVYIACIAYAFQLFVLVLVNQSVR